MVCILCALILITAAFGTACVPAEHGAFKDPLVLHNLNYGGTVISPNITATAGCRFVGWDAEIPGAVKGNLTFTALYDVFRPK